MTDTTDDSKQSKGTVTRHDLAKVAAEELGAVGASYDFVKDFFDVLGESVTSDESVVIHGFGRFRCLDKKSRVGRNPRTGEEVNITPRRVVSFIASNKFKRILKKEDTGS